jgi:hypothetical protein
MLQPHCQVHLPLRRGSGSASTHSANTKAQGTGAINEVWKALLYVI